MKKLLLLLLCPQLIFAQFVDNFSNNNIDNWQGNTAVFVIDFLHRLQLQAPEASDEATL